MHRSQRATFRRSNTHRTQKQHTHVRKSRKTVTHTTSRIPSRKALPINQACTPPTQAHAKRTLLKRFHFPTTKPRGQPDAHGWLGEGNQLLLKKYITNDTKVVFEFGSWLGLSARFILGLQTQVRGFKLVCVDTWEGDTSITRTDKFDEKLRHLYNTFLINMWPHRDRVIPVKMDGRKADAVSTSAGSPTRFDLFRYGPQLYKCKGGPTDANAVLSKYAYSGRRHLLLAWCCTSRQGNRVRIPDFQMWTSIKMVTH